MRKRHHGDHHNTESHHYGVDAHEPTLDDFFNYVPSLKQPTEKKSAGDMDQADREKAALQKQIMPKINPGTSKPTKLTPATPAAPTTS
jgi:hypothetical protein